MQFKKRLEPPESFSTFKEVIAATAAKNDTVKISFLAVDQAKNKELTKFLQEQGHVGSLPA